MSADFQTIAALIVVALAATWLLRRSFGKSKGGCGSSGECGAVSRDVKALQARLRR